MYVVGWPFLLTVIMVWWTFAQVPVPMSSSLVTMVFGVLAGVDVLGMVMLYPDSPFRWSGTVVLLLAFTVAQVALIACSFLAILFWG